MMKRLLNTCGETLIETMAAMIVIMLGLTMLAGALLASGKVNQEAAKQVSSVKSENILVITPADAEKPYSVIIKSGGITVTPAAPTPTPMVIPVHVLQRGEGGSVTYSYERITPTPTTPAPNP